MARRMISKIKIVDSGDSLFLPELWLILINLPKKIRI